jgi:hypothetical protein
MEQFGFLRSDVMPAATEAFEAAWEEAQLILGAPPLDPNGIRGLLARRIMAAAARGEKDAAKLKQIALGAVDA